VSQPNFTVSKIGSPWLEEVGHCHSSDLPPLLFIRWSAVNDLQLEFPDCTIWLTFETIHVIKDGQEFCANWAEDDILRSFCQ